MQCLSILLIPGKSKPSEGDIPFFMKFVSVSSCLTNYVHGLCNVYVHIQNDTPPSQAAEVGNIQPHIVIFNHDEYNQFLLPLNKSSTWSVLTWQWQYISCWSPLCVQSKLPPMNL